MAEIIAYIVVFSLFTIGSFYNFNIRKQSPYPAQLTKVKIAFGIILFIVLLSIAHYLGYPYWQNYPIVLAAITFIASGAAGEGIHKEGIYYRPSGRGNFMRLAKWEDITDVKFNLKKNKLENFNVHTEKMSPNQYYKPEDISEIELYIKTKIK